jgi:hypothetical protein
MLAAELKATEAEQRMSLQEMADDKGNTPGKSKPRSDSNGSGGKSGKNSNKAAACQGSPQANLFAALAAQATPKV